ncbi:(Fe-S)-binding protein [Pseudomonas hefeiensis]|uniref:(Fe-S)-binding protein n=1 Tax=Pseudomonas hefeiensis TaxID=2738125 RepID=UPI002735D96E|nr:(Fe-S)-binding protein [Pseudomonas sp. FP53]WLH97868.1 (Fe-S)-binding protein [Pseudomonas sp. FP53]
MKFAVGGAEEPDSGALAFDIGDQKLARNLAEKTVAWVKKSGALRLITCSDTAFMAFRSVYPRLGIRLDDVEVLHISQWLAQSAVYVRQPDGLHFNVVTYHDGCRLGRLSEPYIPWNGEWKKMFNSLPVREPDTPIRFGTEGIYEDPRALLASVGTHVVEMERTREFSYCCGAGGGGAEANADFAKQAGLVRLQEALSVGVSTMVTSCGTCANHMNQLAVDAGLPIKVQTLLDHLCQRGANGAVAVSNGDKP